MLPKIAVLSEDRQRIAVKVPLVTNTSSERTYCKCTVIFDLVLRPEVVPKSSWIICVRCKYILYARPMLCKVLFHCLSLLLKLA